MMNEVRFHCGRATRLSSIVVATALVSACAEGPDLAFLQPKDKPGASVEQASASVTQTLEERDVESPEVFQSEEAGLWDGRPSLGGVWVAHPDVTEPERVVIRNNANGKEVIGALFRRERDIPGPRLQASSDAAVALGMLAGAPVQLNVVALRKQVVEQVREPAPETQVAEAVPTVEDVKQTSLDPIAGAAAAIEASEDTATIKPAEESTVVETATAPTASDVDAAVAEATAEAKPAKKSWLAGLFAGNRNKNVGEPLTALKPEDQRLASAEPVVTSDAAPVQRPQPRASRLEKPFVQIGIFSVESNAERAANQMRSAGMVPTVYAQNSGGKDFWRVVVGPAQTKSERSSLIKQIKGVGFSDAYAVTN